jgi:hypothetical protein
MNCMGADRRMLRGLFGVAIGALMRPVGCHATRKVQATSSNVRSNLRGHFQICPSLAVVSLTAVQWVSSHGWAVVMHCNNHRWLFAHLTL